jgi:hypothetical protein
MGRHGSYTVYSDDSSAPMSQAATCVGLLTRLGSVMDQSIRPVSRRVLVPFCATLVTAVFAGCATPAKKDPVAIKEATPGTAVIYFFRPEVDQVSVWAHPVLAIDDRPVGTLDHGTYTAVSLPTGIHQVSLTAGPWDSANWNQSAEFRIADGVTYYVALWHQNQPTATPDFITRMYGALGYIVFQVLNPPKGSAAARFEPVDRDVAEYGLAGLRFVAPKDDAMAVP